MNIIPLTFRNFYIAGRQKKTLNINQNGIILVFFKMDNCPGCKSFTPLFYNLASQDRNIRYAVINLTQHRQVIQLSRSTVTSIQSVPLIILYNNGAPFAQFTGKKNIPSILKFIQTCSGMIKEKSQSYAPQQQGYYPQQQSQQPSANYAYADNEVEEDDDEKLNVPNEVTPHNTPWENGYKKVDSYN